MKAVHISCFFFTLDLCTFSHLTEITTVPVTHNNKQSSQCLISFRSKVDLGSRPPMALPTSPFLDSPSHAFFWSGRTQTQLELTANATRELSVSACFCQPGVYNLATLSILARPSEGTRQDCVVATPQRPTAASLIIIQNVH